MTSKIHDKTQNKIVRNAVLERDGWRCQHCGSRANLHLHHQLFRSRGGTDSADNLIVLCDYCHKVMHTGIS